MTRENAADRHDGPGIRHRTPWLEWVASGVGLVLTLAVLGSILWQALDDTGSPPAVRVEVKNVSPVEGGYRVEFRARNTAGSTAAQVQIEGRLTGSGDEETSHVVFDYIPAHSTREGGMFFNRDPRSGQFSLRASGFAEP